MSLPTDRRRLSKGGAVSTNHDAPEAGGANAHDPKTSPPRDMSWRGKVAGGAAAAEGSVDAGLEDLFTRLSEQVDAGQHKKALKLCDDILRASPGDADAIACKVVALVELTRYDAAVECCAAAPPAVRDELAFEHAYSLYRSNDIEGALAVLEGTSGKEKGSFRATQLRAQLLYRDGRAEESARIYEELFTVRARPARTFRPSA